MPDAGSPSNKWHGTPQCHWGKGFWGNWDHFGQWPNSWGTGPCGPIVRRGGSGQQQQQSGKGCGQTSLAHHLWMQNAWNEYLHGWTICGPQTNHCSCKCETPPLHVSQDCPLVSGYGMIDWSHGPHLVGILSLIYPWSLAQIVDWLVID